MACRTETETIDGHSVVVTQWNVTTALRIKMRFAKLVGPAMGALQGVNVSDTAALETVFAQAITAIFESDNSDPEAMVTFIKDALTSGGIHIDGDALGEAKFTELFSGDGMAFMYKVLFFVAKVNFGDLIKGRSLKAIPGAASDNHTAEPDTQT